MPLVYTDVIVDLSYGDCGKGKVTHSLLKNNDYTHVLRYNGGCNAGHTIFHNGEKFVTHHIPAGVFYGVRSIIGPGCVVSKQQFVRELQELRSKGLETDDVWIARNAHLITPHHIVEEEQESRLGTTKRGNGPAYSDKYKRTGRRAEWDKDLAPFMIDLYQEVHESEKDVRILCEGAQGFGLDIDWGDYPYVTSSHCTTAGALLNGLPWHSVRYVYGVIKGYETYVGSKDFDSEHPLNERIRTLGQEYGATTGRPRQINWLDLDLVERAAKMNGITHLIVNKMDILKELGYWALISNESVLKFPSEQDMKSYIASRPAFKGVEIVFSYTPEDI